MKARRIIAAFLVACAAPLHAVEDANFIVKLAAQYQQEIERSTHGGARTIQEFLTTAQHGLLQSYETTYDERAVTLSDPLLSFHVSADKVASYTASLAPQKAYSLLEDEQSVLYLIASGSTPVSTVALRRKAAVWNAVKYGSPHFAETIRTATAAIPQALAGKMRIFIDISALEASFIGILDDHELKLVPLRTNKRLGLTQGTVLSAHDTFVKLSRIAAETHPFQ